jgi:hypothetical protein
VSSNTAQEWYSLYKDPDTNSATVRVQDTTVYESSSCPNLDAVLYDETGTDNVIASAGLGDNSAALLTVPSKSSSDPSGLYYVEITDQGCGQSGTTNYSVEPEPSSEFENPPQIPTGDESPESSIGDAVPRLQGNLSYTGTVTSGTAEDWYALYKDPDTTSATVKVEDTTVNQTTSCPNLNAVLYDNTGTDNVVSSAGLGQDSAAVLQVPSQESSNRTSVFYLEISDQGCTGGGTTYELNPEPSSQWEDPNPLPFEPLPEGTSLTKAGGPLQGGVSYFDTLDNSNTNYDYFVDNSSKPLYPAVEDTTSGEMSNCPNLSVVIESSGGDVFASAGLGSDSATNFSPLDQPGKYYVAVNDQSCKPTTKKPTYQLSLSPSSGVTPIPPKIPLLWTARTVVSQVDSEHSGRRSDLQRSARVRRVPGRSAVGVRSGSSRDPHKRLRERRS